MVTVQSCLTEKEEEWGYNVQDYHVTMEGDRNENTEQDKASGKRS